MKLDHDTWTLIFPFLEEAQDVPTQELESWLARLTADRPEIGIPLSEVLVDQLKAQRFLESPARIEAEVPSRIGDSVGAYTIESFLGKGGMGEVWLAQRSDGRFHGLFAVKFLDAHAITMIARDRFRREGRMLARLTHSNIARLVDAGVTPDEQPYLVLEYVNGKPVDQFCNVNSLDVTARVQLFLQVLAAVAHAHTNLVVHRDIKPSNVLVTLDGTVKLLDFGVAKLIGGELAPEDQAQATRIEDVALTPDYASPEQLLGESPSTATDVFQLGVLLHLLLARCLPASQSHRTRAERLQTAFEETSVRASDSAPDSAVKLLRGDLDAIIAKALRRRPEERYPTAAAFASELLRYMNHEPVEARDGAYAYRVKKFVRRYRRAVIGTSVAILALLATTTFALVQLREARLQRDQSRSEERRGDAENHFLTQILTTIGSDSQPVTPKQILDKGVQLLDRQYANDRAFRVDLLVRIANSFLEIGDEQKGFALLSKAKEIATGLGSPAITSQIECALVGAEIYGGHIQNAALHLSIGQAALTQIAQPSVADRTRCMQADSRLMAAQGNMPVAIEKAKKTVYLLEQSGETRDILYNDALENLGTLYDEAGNVRQSYETTKKQVEVSQQNGWSESAMGVDSRHNLASTLMHMGEITSAFVEEQRVLDISRSGSADGLVEAPISQLYGVLLTKLNRLPEAIQAFDESLRAASRDGDILSEVYSRGGLAKALVEAGRFDEAASQIDKVKALTKGNEVANRRPLAAQAITESSLLKSQGKLAAARNLIETTLAKGMTDKSGPSSSLGFALEEASRIAAIDGRSADAERYAIQAVTTFEKFARTPELSGNVGEALLLVSKAQLNQGRSVDARQTATKAFVSLKAGFGDTHPLTLEAAARAH